MTPEQKPVVGRVVHFFDENKKGPFLGHVIEVPEFEKFGKFDQAFVNLDVHLTYKDGLTRFQGVPYSSDGVSFSWRYTR